MWSQWLKSSEIEALAKEMQRADEYEFALQYMQAFTLGVALYPFTFSTNFRHLR